MKWLLLAALCASACTKVVVKKEIVYVERPAGPVEPPAEQRDQMSEDGTPSLREIDKVIDAARAHLGKTTVHVRGRSFRYDCSGFVRGMFWAAGLDLMGEAGDPDDNGVRLIFHYVERHGENHFRKLPTRGDLVYFDNTWDKNGDGKLNDPLTHVGIVESVASDGTLQILHRANRGIVRDKMNLLKPHDLKDEQGREINAYLRPKGRRDPPATPHLMSELFAGFGTVKDSSAVSQR